MGPQSLTLATILISKVILFNLGNAASFLAEQAGVFGPILFGVLIASVITLLRNKSTDAEKWLF
jgi:hypothetical protein